MPDDTDSSTGLPIGEPVAGEPARRPERVVLAGRYVSLAPLDPQIHGSSLFELTSGAENHALWLYLSEGPFVDRASFDANLGAKAQSEDPLYYAILDAPAGRAMGHAAFLRIEPRHRVIEVGSILYAPPFQRTRGATEAMYLMARYAFEDLGYRRYEWKCNAHNEPSRRAALRLGFTFEGIFRQHMIVKGRNRDTAWFSMLDTEWPDHKAGSSAGSPPAISTIRAGSGLPSPSVPRSWRGRVRIGDTGFAGRPLDLDFPIKMRDHFRRTGAIPAA